MSETETKSFTFDISDADGDNLTLMLNNAPDFMTLSREANTVTVNLAP
jgi:hypothetical protein